MTKKRQKEETPSHQTWIKIRPDGCTHHENKAGPFIWNPNFIPEGKILEVNLKLAEKLIRLLKLKYPIKICSYHPPNQNAITVRIPTTQKSNELVALSADIPIQKPDNHKVDYDPFSCQIRILINFSAIAEYVQSKLKLGYKDPEFPKQYGEEINNAIKTKLSTVCMINYQLELDNNNDNTRSELETYIIACALSLPFLTASLISISLLEITNKIGINEANVGIIGVLLFAILLFEAGYSIANFTAIINYLAEIKKPNLNNQNIKKKIKNLFEGVKDKKFRQLFYPSQLIEKLIIPLIYSKTIQEQLIRGKK